MNWASASGTIIVRPAAPALSAAMPVTAVPSGPPRSCSREHALERAETVVELIVEVDRGVDQRQVAERLREVAELLPGAADLLGVEAQMVGVGMHFFERQSRVVQPAGPGLRVR